MKTCLEKVFQPWFPEEVRLILEALRISFAFLSKRVGEMLAMNLYGYIIIGYQATNIYKNIYKNKMAKSVWHQLDRIKQ